jgi:dipeptidyl aminopeptidase/acylaminoacyl peptidase
MTRSTCFLFSFYVATTAFANPAESSDPLRVDDWAALRAAAPAAVSPDGQSVLYRVSFGGAKGPSNNEWRLIGIDGTNSRKLDLPEQFTPFSFTRDGASLYGAYEINKLKQFAVFPLADLKVYSTPSLVVLLPRGIQSAIASPDGSRVAMLADPRVPDPLAEVHTVVESDQFSVYVINADGTGGKWWCPELRNIASGDLSILGSSSVAWSPDGTSVAVLSITPKIGFHHVRSAIDVCTAGPARRVAGVPNVVSGITWASGGKELGFLSTTNSVLTVDHLWTVPSEGGTPVDQTPKLKGSAMAITADPHGRVWVLVHNGVQSEIDTFQGGTLTAEYRWQDGIINGLPIFSEFASAHGQIVLGVEDPGHASNIAIPQGHALRKITTEGDEQLAKVALGPVRVVHWTSKEGIALEGIATFPAGYDTTRKYPFLVLPHGGPEWNDRLAFDALPRLISGLGYVVLQPEYRGSTGYGADFLQAIYQHFGDRAFRDVDSATDFAIAQGWADPSRLAIFGWSGGGFMTAWTVTQTNRYRAAIEGAGITDWASFVWTSDLPQFDYDGRWPDEDPAAFLQFSAVAHSANVTTPLLVLHGAADLRVPTFQGRELFEALAARGKITRLVTYPGSPHFPRLWEQRRDVFNEITAWLAKFNP